MVVPSVLEGRGDTSSCRAGKGRVTYWYQNASLGKAWELLEAGCSESLAFLQPFSG